MRFPRARELPMLSASQPPRLSPRHRPVRTIASEVPALDDAASHEGAVLMSREPEMLVGNRGSRCCLIMMLGIVFGSALALTSSSHGDQNSPPASDTSSVPLPYEGVFLRSGTYDELEVRKLKGKILELKSSEGWLGVGMMGGIVYRGVFKFESNKDSRLSGVMGVHTIDWKNPDEPILYATYVGVSLEPMQQKWLRRRPGDSRALDPPRTPLDPDHPRFGDFVYVEELPEVITKVSPDYPREVREAGVEGQVVVHALVLKDGTVGDTRIVSSIPMLDASAVAAIRQCRFKPAMAKSKPVAVWVAIPIRFRLR